MPILDWKLQTSSGGLFCSTQYRSLTIVQHLCPDNCYWRNGHYAVFPTFPPTAASSLNPTASSTPSLLTSSPSLSEPPRFLCIKPHPVQKPPRRQGAPSSCPSFSVRSSQPGSLSPSENCMCPDSALAYSQASIRLLCVISSLILDTLRTGLLRDLSFFLVASLHTCKPIVHSSI
ncbi:uncharacterized protein LACBIDRAFT_329823 [Laccaria bicolor S238N-H82]|uniref:Predicted protein n=1 Tax=Laccaria bicolor (strain S238N-H82 / ATCC MYA-4686) TaxID=486041 RepID=B0DJC1_LACBS|nr:uncharacterized protein LACBIDRAFT_329823 [Laccaria bicolor S238N-H82]EDR05495.1 predicted protein [Laccaria bicolor S238N-H82]|eukprot:XP_001884053.1 predicted protein [Laccaria bicolor S238N-H82]